MTNTINYQNIERYAYDNIFELINTRSNIPDPRNRPSSAKFVYRYDPLDSVNVKINSSGFPHIVLGALTGVEESQKSTDGSTKRYAWTQTIIVRSLRYGANGSNAEKGMSDLHDISSSLHQYFNSKSARNALSDLKMRNIKLTKVSSTNGVFDALEYYEVEFELSYSVRLAVVA